MTTDDLVRVGVTGNVYVADVGTTLPTDIATALTAFTAVGHIDPDALTEAFSVTSERIRSWQKKAGIRTVATEVDWTFVFVAMETSPIVLELYYAGAASTTTGGISTTTVTNEPGTVSKAVVIEIIDGLITTRYTFPVVEITERGEATHNGSAASGYELTMSITGDAANLGYRITNDPDFATLAS